MILPNEPEAIENASGESTKPAETLELIPARMLNEHVYCPRLFYLEFVDGLFAHNADTLEGTIKHKRVDKKPDELPPARGSARKSEAREKQDAQKIHARSVTLASDELGIIAKLDLVEAQGQVATPVDYKRGSPKRLEDGSLSAWDPERVQIGAQALVLRANGYECTEGVLYFAETRQRVRIPVDDELIQLTRASIAAARRTADSNACPPPLQNSPKCPRCSLVGICLPDETKCYTIQQNGGEHRLLQPLLFDIGPHFASKIAAGREGLPSPVRQLMTPRDERRPLYLNTQGAYVSVSSKLLKVKKEDKLLQEVRLKELNQVSLFGNVQVSTQAVHALLAEEIPLVYFSYGGWFRGTTQASGLKNILWRREQFRMADRNDFCLSLAKALVDGKIRNQRTILMRNHVEPSKHALRYMKAILRDVPRAESLQELLGIEGLAARIYFENFQGMIKVGEASSAGESSEPAQGALSVLGFQFEHRNRRPPRDPVNALLSLGYSLLTRDLTIACQCVGLDPYLGYFHQPRSGRPALALDLMEPFRPLVVDSAVLSAINQRMVTPQDFLQAGDAVALTQEGRKAFIRAYEQRMDQLVTHPIFGYRVSYRRLLEIQTRLLARVLVGEILRYPVFITR